MDFNLKTNSETASIFPSKSIPNRFERFSCYGSAYDRHLIDFVILDDVLSFE